MSAVVMHPAEALPLDSRRGTASMLLFIVTEAMLFVALFFAYFFFGREQAHWPMDEPPKLVLALTMLVVLLVSSAVLQWGEIASRRGHGATARLCIVLTLLLGLTFVALQFFEYRDHLRTLKPTTDVYGSIFYLITSVHGLHIGLGLCMLLFVLVQPQLAAASRPPHRPLHNASLYWHFVDAAWVVIVAILYVLPRLG